MITRGGCPRASGVAVGLHVYATRHSKPPVMSCYQKDEIVDFFFLFFHIDFKIMSFIIFLITWW